MMLMIDFIQILMLVQLGLTRVEIAQSVQISRPVITKVLTFLNDNHITLEIAQAMGNDELNRMFRSKPPPLSSEVATTDAPMSQKALPDFQYIHDELPQKGVTLKLLWNEYRQKSMQDGFEPYKYSRFCALYGEWAHRKKLVMRVPKKPGNILEVDWAGLKPKYYDPETGNVMEAHVFVAALPYSMHFYYAIFLDEQIDSWIEGHVQAFEFFGGVPRILVPDNCKTAVTNHKRLDIALNKDYREMCNYYKVGIVPARVKKPQDKPHAEGSVGIVERELIAPLRKKKMTGLKEVEEALAIQYEKMEDEIVSVLDCSRKEYYEKEEKSFMRQLPADPYQHVKWSTHKVGNDYLIHVGSNYYSVPYTLAGKEVQARMTNTALEVYQNFTLVAKHTYIDSKQRFPIVLEEHMPENHKAYLHYTKEEFLKFAESVGPNTLDYFKYMMDSHIVPDEVYPYCVSLQNLAKKYGNSNLENACAAQMKTGKIDLKILDDYVKHPEKIPKVSHASEANTGYMQYTSQGMTRGIDQFSKADDSSTMPSTK